MLFECNDQVYQFKFSYMPTTPALVISLNSLKDSSHYLVHGLQKELEKNV
jgi:hypothetical protein